MENSTDASIWILNFVYTIKITMIIFIIIVFLWKSFEYSTKETFDFSQVMGNFVVSVFLGLFAWFVPSFVIKIYGFETYVSDRKNSKGEKIVELTENEKMKKLNAYRKINHKDILLVSNLETDYYFQMLKKKNLLEKALKESEEKFSCKSDAFLWSLCKIEDEKK